MIVVSCEDLSGIVRYSKTSTDGIGAMKYSCRCLLFKCILLIPRLTFKTLTGCNHGSKCKGSVTGTALGARGSIPALRGKQTGILTRIRVVATGRVVLDNPQASRGLSGVHFKCCTHVSPGLAIIPEKFNFQHACGNGSNDCNAHLRYKNSHTNVYEGIGNSETTQKGLRAAVIRWHLKTG